VSKLELRFPPDVVWIVVAALMWIAAALTPQLAITMPNRIAIALIVVAIGVALVVAGRVALGRANTTWHPTEPEKTTSLVTTGVFRFSRNPIYLGMMAALLGWALVLGSASAWLVSALFVLYMNRFQIAPEERALSALLGDEYAEYAKFTRRWV